MSDATFDLSKTFVQLGLGSRAVPVFDFGWSTERLERYEQETADDGDEGRLVAITPQASTWTAWERHPAGDELVLLLSGRGDVVQEIEGQEQALQLAPGWAAINPAGVWHRSVVHEPGRALFITPGRDTEHRALAG
jgi:quercetin dioxygenase-like cupin family protein